MEEENGDIILNAPPPANGAFGPIPNERLGDPIFSLSYPFEPGSEPDTIARYRDMSAFEIVLDLAMPFLKSCANALVVIQTQIHLCNICFFIMLS